MATVTKITLPNGIVIETSESQGEQKFIMKKDVQKALSDGIAKGLTEAKPRRNLSGLLRLPRRKNGRARRIKVLNNGIEDALLAAVNKRLIMNDGWQSIRQVQREIKKEGVFKLRGRDSRRVHAVAQALRSLAAQGHIQQKKIRDKNFYTL